MDIKKITDNQNNFQVYCLKEVAKEDVKYTHWSKGLTMYIIKDGQKIEFDSEEITKIVKALPKTIGGSY